MPAPIDAIKSLREKTGAPLGDVRSALEKAGGDPGKAAELLKQRGFEAALKRQGRATTMGRIESYIHHDGRVNGTGGLSRERVVVVLAAGREGPQTVADAGLRIPGIAQTRRVDRLRVRPGRVVRGPASLAVEL